MGQTIVWLIPDRATVSDALHALAYGVTKDDLPLIETVAQGSVTRDNEIKQQAASTAKAISSRPQSEK